MTDTMLEVKSSEVITQFLRNCWRETGKRAQWTWGCHWRNQETGRGWPFYNGCMWTWKIQNQTFRSLHKKKSNEPRTSPNVTRLSLFRKEIILPFHGKKKEWNGNNLGKQLWSIWAEVKKKSKCLFFTYSLKCLFFTYSLRKKHLSIWSKIQ